METITIYLDNAATTPLTDEVKQYVINLLDQFANPSSLYEAGQLNRQLINQARKTVAQFIHANAKDIFFTPSGCASNTLATHIVTKDNLLCNYYYSPTAHKSILQAMESVKSLAFDLKVDHKGFIDISYLDNLLTKHQFISSIPIVITEYANSEIGTIQDVKSIIDITHKHHGICIVDCTGSIPSIPVDVKQLQADIITFSGHKLHALKGCGVLYKKTSIQLSPLIYGSQEQGICAGTENILGIASLEKALEHYNYSSIQSFNRDYVWNYIKSNIPNTYLVGATIESNKRLPNNLYLCFKNIDGDSLMMLLDLKGLQVSTGSACVSNDYQPSPTLTAIGMDKLDIHSCIRISFSGKETINELNFICETIYTTVETLRNLH